MFFQRFYLFIHERHIERGRDIGRGRIRLLMGSLTEDSIPGLGSHPEPKAYAQLLSHPGIPTVFFKKYFIYLFMRDTEREAET